MLPSTPCKRCVQLKMEGDIIDTGCGCGREEDETIEREDGSTESLFGNLKRAAGIDTNKFVIVVTYQTFSSGESNPKKVAVTQDESFEVMLKQQFFTDLLQHGPLLIQDVNISSEKPERTYHVHKKLVKSLDVSANQHSFKDLSTSIVQSLHINLKFDEKKSTDESEFTEALLQVAKWLNIKYVTCFFNGEERQLSGDRQQTSTDDEAILEDIFSRKNSEISAKNTGKSGPFRALFISDVPNSTALVVYRPQDKLGKPAHFMNATLIPSAAGNSNYTIRWADTKQTDEFSSDFVFAVPAGQFADYQRILVPAYKAKVDAVRVMTKSFEDQPAPPPAEDEYNDADTKAPADGGSVGTRSGINYAGTTQPAITTSTVTDVDAHGDTAMTTRSTTYDESGRVSSYTSNTSSCVLL